MNPFRIGLYNHDFVVNQNKIPTLLGFTSWWTDEGSSAEAALHSAAARFDGMVWIGVVDFDYCAEVFSKYAITKIPTLLMLENGYPVKRFENYECLYDIDEFILE